MMKVTNRNFFKIINEIGLEKVHDVIQDAYDWLKEVVDDHGWAKVDGDDVMKDVKDLLFESLQEHVDAIEEVEKSKEKPKATPKSKSKQKRKTPSKKKKKSGIDLNKKKSRGSGKRKRNKKGGWPPTDVKLVRDMSVELRLMRRFVNMNGKEKTYKQTLLVLAAINRAVEKDQIRKTKNPTPYWKEIQWMQEELLSALQNRFGGKSEDERIVLGFDEKKTAAAKKIISGFSLHHSTRHILRFIGMEGKAPGKTKAEALLKTINNAQNAGKIRHNDPNAWVVDKMKLALNLYIDGTQKTVNLEDHALHGLADALNGCGCKGGMNGLGKPEGRTAEFWPVALPLISEHAPVDEDDNFAEDPFFASSTERDHELPEGEFIIAPPRGGALSFRSDQMPKTSEDRLAFSGKWRSLLNQPPEGFSMILYGPPKSGKSTLAIDLGGYLARGFGKVLYASIEEGVRATITERFDRLRVTHPDLVVSNYLPSDLSDYKFVIVDSVSRGNMDIETLQALLEGWPGISFVFIFHVTKGGLPRGSNQFQHEVDVLVEVRDGIASAIGRFGPGEMPIRFN